MTSVLLRHQDHERHLWVSSEGAIRKYFYIFVFYRSFLLIFSDILEPNYTDNLHNPEDHLESRQARSLIGSHKNNPNTWKKNVDTQLDGINDQAN